MILWFGKKGEKDPRTGETPVEPRPAPDAGAAEPEKKKFLGLFGGKKGDGSSAGAVAEDDDTAQSPLIDSPRPQDSPPETSPDLDADGIFAPGAAPEVADAETAPPPSPLPAPAAEEPDQPPSPLIDSPRPPAPEPEPDPNAPESFAPGALPSGTEAEPERRPPPVAPPSADAEAPPSAPIPDEAEDPLAETRKPGFLSRMTEGLKRSSSKLADGISSVFVKKKLDDETLEDLEDLLISSDLGARVAVRVCDAIRKDRFDKEVDDAEIKQALAAEIARVLKPREEILDLSEGPSPRVMLFVGVNGSGKTTTIGKIAAKLTSQGANVLLAAGDTFRAAAVEQLKVWAERAGAGFVSRPQGADSAGLAYDAVTQAKAEGRDLVLIDTAGRLQNRQELMDELAKVLKAIRKVDVDAPHDVILVLDATVGQNALQQVEAFKHTAGVSGLVMTKLDGTAKGGVLVAIADQHSIPIHFVGVGEKAEDLHPFSAEAFARALVGLADGVTG